MGGAHQIPDASPGVICHFEAREVEGALRYILKPDGGKLHLNHVLTSWQRHPGLELK